MKKIIFAATFLFLATTGYSQLNLGLKASYTSSLSIDNISSVPAGQYNFNKLNSDLKNNFQGGAFARLSLGKIYIQPEILYSFAKKGYQVTFADGTTVDKSLNMNTIDVPILLGYKLLDLKLMNIRAFAGPKLRFNAGSQLDPQVISSGGTNATTLYYEAKKAQAGLEAGVGVDLLMFTLDLRYNLIGDLYQTTLNKVVSLDKLPSSTFLVSLGWKIF